MKCEKVFDKLIIYDVYDISFIANKVKIPRNPILFRSFERVLKKSNIIDQKQEKKDILFRKFDDIFAKKPFDLIA